MIKLVFTVFTSLCLLICSASLALACLSITDDFNLPNPTLSANFDFVPDLNPFSECWNGEFRVRSKNNNWRLVADRVGPTPISTQGDPKNDIHAKDLTFQLNLMSFGMADPNGAILVPPFDSATNLSSIHSGTFVVSGIKKSGNSCLPQVPHYYAVSNNLCLFRDFVYNVGSYQGQVSYLLVAP